VLGANVVAQSKCQPYIRRILDSNAYAWLGYIVISQSNVNSFQLHPTVQAADINIVSNV
jgi:hypothetical protein